MGFTYITQNGFSYKVYKHFKRIGLKIIEKR